MAQTRPNIVFVHVDQMQYAAIGAYGCRHARTPNLDAFIAGGTSFAESHSANPVCCPARTSWYTGRMSSEHGVVANSLPLAASIPDLGQWLTKYGYDCYYGGKWHVPNRDVAASFKLIWDVGLGERNDAMLAQAAEAFLLSHAGDRPFFLNLGFMNPHDICYFSFGQNPGKYSFAGTVADELPPLPASYDRSRPIMGSERDVQYHIYTYYRLVEMIDCELGRVFRAIANSRFAPNTLVIFTGDHGEMLAAHNLLRKGQAYDEAVKVPLAAMFPGVVKAGVLNREHLVSGVDITATILDYAGAPSMPEMTFARSLRPTLEGRPVPSWRSYVAAETAPPRSQTVIRTRDYKYVAALSGDELYSRKDDPHEMHNLAGDGRFAGVLAEQKKLLAEYRATIKAMPEPPGGWGAVRKAKSKEDDE